MASKNLLYYSQVDFRKGICDSQENLNLKNQVLDARNVWAPYGTLVRRPGYSAVTQRVSPDVTPTGSATYVDTGTIYLGSNSNATYQFLYDPDTTNVNAGCQFRYDYWDGTAWRTLTVYQTKGPADNHVPLATYCGAAQVVAWFVPPSNWALTTVNSLSRYWIRCVAVGTQAPSATPTAAPIVGLRAISTTANPSAGVFGVFQAKYSQGQNYTVGYRYSDTQVNFNSDIFVSPLLTGGFSVPVAQELLLTLPAARSPPMQGTTVPEFNVAFVTYSNVVYQVTNANTVAVAAVSTDPLITSTDPNIEAPYNADLVPQLNAFPAANYIINFRNLLFAAGIAGQPTLIRWSGAVNEGAYNVWPETSFETLSTARDNSPITGIAPLGDNLVVFKQDSIWQLVYNGLDDLQLPTFIPQVVVVGVGCVSQGSIQEIRGQLVFLAEDGFYAFNGTPDIKKLSDNINTTTSRINPSHRVFATAVNWRSRHTYLCSTALDESSSNNIIFAYDYKQNAWWLWDSIPAEFLLVTSDTALQEQVIFGNQTAGFFKLTGEKDNFADIDNYILTGRFGEDDVMYKVCREIRLREQNIDGDTDYTLYGDDLQLDVDSKTCVMGGVDETHATPNPTNGCTNVSIRRRERKMPQRLSSEWFQVKAENFGLLEGINIGYLPESRR